MYTGVFTEEEFRSLGIMGPFVADEVFAQLDRSFFTQNLDYLSGLCYRRTKMDIVARILQEPATFGYRPDPGGTSFLQRPTQQAFLCFLTAPWRPGTRRRSARWTGFSFSSLRTNCRTFPR